MKKPQELTAEQAFNRRVIDLAIKIGAMAVIFLWCFAIVSPFYLITIWAAILAVALFPLHAKLSSLLKGNKNSFHHYRPSRYIAYCRTINKPFFIRH